jgi:putative pyruvate formate lyase activating enzyme
MDDTRMTEARTERVPLAQCVPTCGTADQRGSYLELSDREFEHRIRLAYAHLQYCDLCPVKCGASRLSGRPGVCGAALRPRVFVWNIHRGEEPPVSGLGGSGTVFLSGCNLRCCYCQNYPLSQLGHGSEYSVPRLAAAMNELQRRGAHNINFVTPSHQVAQILAAVLMARRQGLTIPLVYNTSSYDSVETLGLLDGIVDIYLGDYRYTDDVVAHNLSGAADYPTVARAALEEMHRQVGDLVACADGTFVPHGLIVRYLVLPRLARMAKDVFQFVHERLSVDTYVSVMTQYFPAYKALDGARGVGRKITEAEFDKVMNAWHASGLVHGWVQELDGEGGA